MMVLPPEHWHPSDLVFLCGRRLRNVVRLEGKLHEPTEGPLCEWEQALEAKGYSPRTDGIGVMIWEVATMHDDGDGWTRYFARTESLTILRMGPNEREADLA